MITGYDTDRHRDGLQINGGMGDEGCWTGGQTAGDGVQLIGIKGWIEYVKQWMFGLK